MCGLASDDIFIYGAVGVKWILVLQELTQRYFVCCKWFLSPYRLLSILDLTLFIFINNVTSKYVFDNKKLIFNVKGSKSERPLNSMIKKNKHE